jgi:tetratricopeptide (TPR) repeat protein
MTRALGPLIVVSMVAIGHADARRDAKAHFAQGQAFHDAGAYDDAIKEYEVAYRLAPLPPILFNIGQCQRLKGDKRAALDSYQRYVAAQPEGDLADEARQHIANLKLRIEVEEAEAAKKRAIEEAAEARRHAEEVEREHKRTLEEEAGKRRDTVDEQARLQQGADELQRREVQKRADEDAARQRRIAAARRGPQKWINAGGITVGAGLLVFALGWAPIIDGALRDPNLRFNDPSKNAWTTQNDADAAAQSTDSKVALGMWIAGGIVAVAGVIVCIVGVHKRNEAVARAERAP